MVWVRVMWDWIMVVVSDSRSSVVTVEYEIGVVGKETSLIVFVSVIMDAVLISRISVEADEYEIELAGDIIVVGRETTVSVEVIMDRDEDAGSAEADDSLPGRYVTVEGLEPLPMAFVSVQGTVMTVVMISVVTDPILAGQSVIVWAQDVMV